MLELELTFPKKLDWRDSGIYLMILLRELEVLEVRPINETSIECKVRLGRRMESLINVAHIRLVKGLVLPLVRPLKGTKA